MHFIVLSFSVKTEALMSELMFASVNAASVSKVTSDRVSQGWAESGAAEKHGIIITVLEQRHLPLTTAPRRETPGELLQQLFPPLPAVIWPHELLVSALIIFLQHQSPLMQS